MNENMNENDTKSEWKITVGLEIHAELHTNSKMFCSCKNDPDATEPNIYTCPICMGHPGTLPVMNFEAVKKVLQVGLALNSNIADFTEWDRKNYFYPDIPKGYQISQFAYPLVRGGYLAGVDITRIHLEEDTARSSHEKPDVSLVDFNRAGLPLMELVTEPVIHSSEQAMQFARELQLLLQYLGVSEANMEKGQMRVEVNISISKDENFGLNQSNGLVDRTATAVLGTKVEVKNINSFKAAGKSIDFEFKRQKEILESGGKVVQETRGWDENKNVTFSQRTKENSDDYRYFPDPDLPKMKISEIPELNLEKIKSELRETPRQKRDRFASKYGLKASDIETFINMRTISDYFEVIAERLTDVKPDLIKVQLAANYITSDISGMIKNSDISETEILSKLSPNKIVELIQLISSGEISSRGAKDILKLALTTDESPRQIAEKNNLIVKNDAEALEALQKMAIEVINANPNVVADYKAGKTSVLMFFVGQIMKLSKGSGNPEVIKTAVLDILSKL